MKIKNIFCWLFGHNYFYVGPHEKICLQCLRADSDVYIDDLPAEKVNEYKDSILMEYVSIIIRIPR